MPETPLAASKPTTGHGQVAAGLSVSSASAVDAAADGDAGLTVTPPKAALDPGDQGSVSAGLVTKAYADLKHGENARFWLSWIARRMGTEHDLAWWQVTAWVPRWQMHLAGAVLGAVEFGLLGAVELGVLGALEFGALGAVEFALLGVLGALEFGPSLPETRSRAQAHPALRHSWFGAARRTQIDVVAVASTFAALAGVKFGVAGGASVALVGVATFGYLHRRGSRWGTPGPDSALAAYRSDAKTAVRQGIAGATVMGATFSTVAALTGQPAANLASCLSLGLTAGLVAGIPAGLSARPAATLWLGQLVLWMVYRRRIQVMALLEEAADLGILRRCGTCYQFQLPAVQAGLAALGRPTRVTDATPLDHHDARLPNR